MNLIYLNLIYNKYINLINCNYKLGIHYCLIRKESMSKKSEFLSGLLGKDIQDKSQDKDKPDEFAKEKEYESLNLYPLRKFKMIMVLISITTIFLFYLVRFGGYLPQLYNLIPIYKYPRPLVITLLSFIFLKSCKCDIWVSHLCSSRIGSTYVKHGLNSLTINYDPVYSKKDIIKLVQELNDKSDDYNYYLHNISKTFMLITLKIGKKVKIPEKAIFEGEYEKNEIWSAIPLGICLTDKAELGTINWKLNKQEKIIGSHKESIPSVSFLVSGSTGCGKSVLENNIIRHGNKFKDRFQLLLVDVKRVEFSRKTDLQGVKAVALDIKEAQYCLESARAIMYSRFKFMEQAGVNDIYDLKDYECDYFNLSGVEFEEFPGPLQFDEIFYCKVNGNVEIITIDKIFNKVRSGDKVEVYFLGQKDRPFLLKLKDDVSNEEIYTIGGTDYHKDDIIDVVVNGEDKSLTPIEILKYVDKGYDVIIPEEEDF